MFSGKSEEADSPPEAGADRQTPVACFKPDLDMRYHRNAIASHSATDPGCGDRGHVEELKAVLMRRRSTKVEWPA